MSSKTVLTQTLCDPKLLNLLEITMASTSTRAKPNAFNNLHQVRRKTLLAGAQGLDAAEYLSSLTKGNLKEVFGMTPAESLATLNLLRST